MPSGDKQPLLTKDKLSNYGGITNQQLTINSNNSSSSESLNSSTTTEDTIITIEDNDWIDTVSRYGGRTQKNKDDSGNWKYETEIRDSTNHLIKNINEEIININHTKHWQKLTSLPDWTMILELLHIDFNNNIIKSYTKEYKDYDDYKQDNIENIENLQEKKRVLSPENKFLEGITIKTINNINQLITNTTALNQQLTLFKENPNNSDLTIFLKLYKYLTVIQNFIDKTKPGIMWNTTYKLLGILEIYLGLTGKNLQRVVSNYPIDGKTHTTQDYLDAIFCNWENYLMVLIDTALGTFLTSAAASWSRDVIFNITNETNPLAIKLFNLNQFQNYQETMEVLLYEENYQVLISHFSKITAVNDLLEKFNEIENTTETEFVYHPHFTKEIAIINDILETRSIENELNRENQDHCITNNQAHIEKLTQVVATANKTINKMEKESGKSLTLAENWGLNLLTNFALELATWAASHIVLTGSSENTSKEDFDWRNLINFSSWSSFKNSDIFATGALVANLSRYFVMRPVNNIFKAGLTTLGIPTNIATIIDNYILCGAWQPCTNIIRWVNNQTINKKRTIAAFLFLVVTFTVNTVKTEAALVTEYGMVKATELFNEKFFRWTTAAFSLGVTAVDMIAFAISGLYKNVFNWPLSASLTKQFTTFARYCGWEFEEKDLVESLEKLEKNGKLASFDEQFKNQQKIATEDSGFEESPTPNTAIETKEKANNYQINGSCQFNGYAINQQPITSPQQTKTHFRTMSY